jgi:hypothetical protein
MDFAVARGIADAVFYEGYLLYPYTATSHKNKLRWQFGIVVPQAQEAAGTCESGHQLTDVVVECEPDAQVDLLFRFLHVQARTVQARAGNDFEPVPVLMIEGTHHFTFDESIEREVVATCRLSAGLPTHIPIRFDGDRSSEELRSAGDVVVGRIVRERWPLAGQLTIEAVDVLDPGSGNRTVRRLRVRVENTSDVVAAVERGAVMRTAFVSAHTLIGIDRGSFWSPIDPPDPSVAARVKLTNEHTWPVLVGDADADTQRAQIVLSSPIVLADFPQIAAKTNADAFDGTEIDELLSLSVLSLSDAERAAARATDPRARAIVERAEAFGAMDVARTHAQFQADPAVRPQLGARRRVVADDVPVYGTPSGADAPPEFVTVCGIAVTKGSSVRLAPKRRADAWDMFLAGKVATVQAIHADFEDKLYVAVTVDDDPATEFHQWYGRSFFFEPDEVEPLGAPS